MYKVKLQLKNEGLNEEFEVIGEQEQDAKNIAKTILQVWPTASTYEKKQIAKIIATKKPLYLQQLAESEYHEFFVEKNILHFARKATQSNTFFVISPQLYDDLDNDNGIKEAAAVRKLQKQKISDAYSGIGTEQDVFVESLDEEVSEEEKLVALIYEIFNSEIKKLPIASLMERVRNLENTVCKGE